MSEIGPGEDFHPKVSFLARNRLISGLADVVIVVEATERSGSLNTATHALEQGRELYAVPGDITRPTSRGCNRLIMQGAMPYTRVEDLIQTLFPVKKPVVRGLTGDNAAETAILRAIAAGERDGERILAKLGMEVVEFNQTITMLEIKGRVRSLGANCWGLG